jgi:signal transduction histidine kinase
MDLMLLDPKCYGLNEEALKLMEHIKQSAEREGRIISRMLEYSTVEIEKKCLQPVLKNISLRTIIEVLIGSRGYHKEVEIDLAIPPAITIVADMDYLFEILAEILTNAVHYSLPPRKIGISYREDETCWYIAIRDNGVGMTQETLNGIFKPFFIGDGNQLSRRYGRIGLGLSIARNRADIMRAHISVESAPGKGSTFTLKLPKYHHKDVIT